MLFGPLIAYTIAVFVQFVVQVASCALDLYGPELLAVILTGSKTVETSPMCWNMT